MRNLRHLRGWLAGLAGVALLLGGFAVASNMGFKFVPNVGANQYFDLSLPWNNNYTNAKSLFDDLDLGGDITRVIKVNDTFTFTSWYYAAPLANNFAIQKGQAYVVEGGGAGITSAVVVGSHDPNFTFTFAAGKYSNAAAPYHQTLTNAKGLYDDMTAQGVGVTRLVKVNPGFTFTSWYYAAPLANNFNLTLGMGVIVESSTGGSGYVWPHY